MKDIGFTHVALTATNAAASIEFYRRYAGMSVVHERVDPSTARKVVWLSDLTRPFVVVLIEVEQVDARLAGFAHLGVGCASRAEVDRLVGLASEEGRSTLGPFDSGAPVGYWAFIADPDGHNLEISHGQEVGLTVQERSAH